jgi:ABC-type amino acid transport substrate-binding protein
MLLRRLICIVLLLFSAAHAANAHSACAPVRIGYMDQDRPPYWLGNGTEVPEPAGIGVDYLRAAAHAVIGCPVQFVRLPVGRLRTALQAGEIDFLPVEERAEHPPEFALPRDRNGAIDRSRALRTSIVVFVRASDKLPADTITPRYFQGKTLGVVQGAAYAGALRDAGILVDEGARDLERNIGKLKLNRIDGVAVSLEMPGDMDQVLAERHGGEVVRLRMPLVNNNIWLATNQTYYAAHREQVDAMWTWIGTHHQQLSGMLAKYSRK